MTILHIITSLKKAAGTSVFVGELASEQAAAGHTVSILVKHRCNLEQPVSCKVAIYDQSSEFKVQSSKFKVQSSENRVRSSENRVQSSKFRVQSSENRAQSSENRVQSSKFRVQSSKFRVQSSENRVQSSKFRVQSSEFEDATLNFEPSTLNFEPSTLNFSPPPDIVHIHALWDPWLTAQARHYRRLGAKIVWSPHGMLTPWALKNHWPKKLLGLLAYQYCSLRAADLIHVTAESEVADVSRLHLKNKLLLAPLGVHLPTLNSELRTLHFERRTSNYICFVSRIQRKKGLPNLLRAWAQLPADLKRGWQIKIAGPDEDNHLAELYTLCAELNLPYTPAPVDAASSPRQNKNQSSTVDLLSRPTFLDRSPEILFLGPVYDAAKDALYANAAVTVLPTYSENFGSVVIESLAQGTPVICTKGAPWRDLVDYNCGWWIDVGVAPLVTALTEAITLANSELSTLNSELPTLNSELSTLNSELSTLNSELRSMGANGRKLVMSKYTWPAVARTVLAGYKETLNSEL